MIQAGTCQSVIVSVCISTKGAPVSTITVKKKLALVIAYIIAAIKKKKAIEGISFISNYCSVLTLEILSQKGK